jgi:hypothetical protein
MRLTLVLPAAAAVLIVVAGCGGGPVAGSGSAGSPESAVASAEEEARDEVAGPATANAVDACALLSDADVEPFVGDGVEGEENPTGGDGGSCTWTNQTDYHSVSLEIGLSGTAADGDLPPWDDTVGPEKPLPDDMRATGGGQVEFVVDTRDCFVQVATNGGDEDEQAAVELARKVRDQL